jgi:TIR domain
LGVARPGELPRLFFSYSRVDAEFVLRLARDLRAAGVNLWIDQLDIAAGDRWDRAVEEALVASPCLLVILSPTSVASQNVMDEVSFDLEKNKKIVLVLYHTCDIPFRLRRLQYIDFTIDYSNGFAQLLRDLNVRTPSPVELDPQTVQNEPEMGFEAYAKSG